MYTSKYIFFKYAWENLCVVPTRPDWFYIVLLKMLQITTTMYEKWTNKFWITRRIYILREDFIWVLCKTQVVLDAALGFHSCIWHMSRMGCQKLHYISQKYNLLLTTHFSYKQLWKTNTTMKMTQQQNTYVAII